MKKQYLLFVGVFFLFSLVHACHCGDGKVNQISEACDMGVLNGIACIADYEETCTYCSLDCQWVEMFGAYCGDGIVQVAYEECDGGAHCDSECHLISPCDYVNDYDCDGVDNETDNCKVVFNPLQIDSDGDGKGDECDPDPFGFCGDLICQTQFGEDCATCQLDCGSCDGAPFCGDWLINGDEECDDGNNFNGDGCSADCKCEWCETNETNGDDEEPEEPTPGENETQTSCGNNILESGETCDYGIQNGLVCDNSENDCSFCSLDCELIEREGPEKKRKRSRSSDDDDDHRQLSTYFSCSPNWKCSEWGSCFNGTVARTCYDANYCAIEINRPLEETACFNGQVKIAQERGGFSLLLPLLILFGILVLILGIIFLRG